MKERMEGGSRRGEVKQTPKQAPPGSVVLEFTQWLRVRPGRWFWHSAAHPCLGLGSGGCQKQLSEGRAVSESTV